MKLNFLTALFLGIAVAFSSCEQANVEPTVSETELVDFAAVATNITASANLVTNTTPTTTATPKIRSCKFSGLETSALPAAVTTYLNTNYAGSTILRAGTSREGGIIVHIQLTDGSKMVVLFDSAGAFVSAGTHAKLKGTRVEISNLPASITDYITANYSGATIKNAATNPEGKFIVVIKKSDESITGLAFNADGIFTTEFSLNGDFKRGKGGKRKGK